MKQHVLMQPFCQVQSPSERAKWALGVHRREDCAEISGFLWWMLHANWTASHCYLSTKCRCCFLATRKEPAGIQSSLFMRNLVSNFLGVCITKVDELYAQNYAPFTSLFALRAAAAWSTACSGFTGDDGNYQQTTGCLPSEVCDAAFSHLLCVKHLL